MHSQDNELERIRAGVSCAVILERHHAPWQLDKRESSRRCLKYRRGAGEVLIVNHDGQGWWDPSSEARGDIFDLVQHLNPGLNFGKVRRLLRPFIGLAPDTQTSAPRRERPSADVPIIHRWEQRRHPAPGTGTWRYLTRERRLPQPVVQAAIRAGVLREGPYASAWFAHRDHDGHLTGIEMRGPDYRGFSEGGDKTLFRLPGRLPTSSVALSRLVVAEAPIDSMSIAALERLRADTLYVATAGGMGPKTVVALEQQLDALSDVANAELAIATDADPPGEQYAQRLSEMARAAGVRSERLLPTGGHNDWNDVLRNGRPS